MSERFEREEEEAAKEELLEFAVEEREPEKGVADPIPRTSLKESTLMAPYIPEPSCDVSAVC